MTTNIASLQAASAPNVPRKVTDGKGRRWAGRILSGISMLFLAFDAIGKLLRLDAVIEGTTSLGYDASVLPWLGALQVICLVAYLVPRTAVLGAVLWTGYLGGAIATHVRLGNPLFSHILFPIYVAALLWGGLYLRDRRVRILIGPADPREV